MNKKHNVFDKLGSFITGKGFYLVVLICVAAIALSGFYLVRSVRNSLSGGEDQPVTGSAPITAAPSPSPSPSPKVSASPSPSVTVSPKPSPSPSSSPAVSPSPSPSPSAPAALVFTWPVNGPVIAGFSVEALAYDETMGDWRTHAGLDIAASIGTQVKATASGTVSALYADDLMGTTVEIDHGNGLVSVYSNLAAVPTVKVGDSVTTGSVIGSVGATAPAESGRAPHLHFAMYRGNEAVDPENYLPEK